MDSKGAVLSQEDRVAYCIKKGLCTKCVRVKTHKRAGFLNGRLEPLTIKDDKDNYVVYKGFCIQPTCFSLNDAKRKLGEITSRENPSIVVAGRKLSGQELRDYAKRNGLCNSCGVTQTHRKLSSFPVTKWKPLTVPNSCTYTVYKGFCLALTCYNLDYVKEILGESSTTTFGRSTQGKESLKSIPKRSPSFQGPRRLKPNGGYSYSDEPVKDNADRRIPASTEQKEEPMSRFGGWRRQQMATSRSNSVPVSITGELTPDIQEEPTYGSDDELSVLPNHRRIQRLKSNRVQFNIPGGELPPDIKKKLNNASSSVPSSPRSDSVPSSPTNLLGVKTRLAGNSGAPPDRHLGRSRSYQPATSSSCPPETRFTKDRRAISVVDLSSTIARAGSKTSHAEVWDPFDGIQRSRSSVELGDFFAKLRSAPSSSQNSANNSTADAVTKQSSTEDMNPSEPVAHRIEQLLGDKYVTILDLSFIKLRKGDLTTLAAALEVDETLERLVLENCTIEDEGFNILAQGVSRAEKTAIVKISLRGNGIHEPRSFQKFIRSLPYLEELNLSENCISGLGAAEIFDALKSDPSLPSFSQIRKLSLAHNELGRGYFLAGKLSLRQFFSQNSTLLVLNLEGNLMDDEGVRAIAEGMRGNTDAVLERLYLADNLFGDDGAEAIASFMTASHCLLQVIGLGGTSIGNSGARAILHALAFNTSVVEISGLGGNKVDHIEILLAVETQLSSRVEDAQALGRIEEVCSNDDSLADEITGAAGGIAGINNPGEIDRVCSQLTDRRQTVDLRRINCSSWALGDPGAASLGRALGITKVLVELRLADNNITAIGARGIARGIEENLDSSLEILDLSSNPIGDMGAAVLGFALQLNQTLTTIFMHSTGIGDLGADAIASGLINNEGSNVSELYLHDNKVGVAGARSVGALLKSNCKISTLTLQRNNLTDDGLKEIICGIEENSKSGLRHLKIAGNSVVDGGLFNKIRKLLNRSIEPAPFSVANPKAQDICNRLTDCSTRVALEAKIALCENKITLAEESDDPVTIREGIESNKRLRTLLPQRDHLPSRGYLERKIQEYEQAMRNLGRLDLEKRLELAAEKILLKTHLIREIKEEERMPQLPEIPLLSVSAPDHGIDSQGVLEETRARGNPQSAAMREASKLRRDLSVDSVEDEVSPTIHPAWSENTEDPSRDESETRNCMAPNGFDRLALFQSAPLGYVDEKTNTQHTIPLLDFDYEACVLKQSLRDAERIGAKIEIEIHAATTDRFSAFFAQGGSRVLHISCHGHPDYLALENGCGDMQALPVEDLRRFIAIGGGNLQVVFVSACFSRRAGEAFIAAGIKHVVCCRQDKKFRDVAAAEFAKNFYRALACKKSLRQAFYLAKEAVRVSPVVVDSRIESDKFLLLPEKPAKDEYHDVPVFFTQPVAPRAILGGGYEDSLRLLPRNPQYFIGREVTMYEILDALKHADVVRVAGGDPGIGRSSVVTAVARYILQRQKSFLIDDLFWLPPPQEHVQSDRAPYADLCKLIELLASSVDDSVLVQEDYKGCWVRILRELQEKRAILVIDGRHFRSEPAHQNMQRFIRDILHIANVKAIVIDPNNRTVIGATHSRGEVVVEIGPLDFRSSALLFGSLSQYITRRRCPEARTAEEFASLLLPPSVGEQKQGIVQSRRRTELFKRIGSGCPAAIRSAALNMEESKFSELVRIAKRPEIKVESRAALEQKISILLKEKEGSLLIKNFIRVRDLQEVVDELKTIRLQLPALEELAEQEAALNAELEIVVAAKQYEIACNIQDRIKLLQNQMSKERFTPGRNLLLSSGTSRSLNFEGQFRSATSSATDDVTRTHQQSSAAFCVSSESDWSRIFIEVGSVTDFEHPAEKTGILCWTNESCDLERSTEGKQLLTCGGYNLFRDVTSLPSIDDGPWGSSKCRIGNATLIGPESYDQVRARYVILAVGPVYSSSESDKESGYLDEDSVHYIETMVRSAYRSSVEQVNLANLAAAAFPIFSAGNPGSELYERTLHIGLQTLVEEIRYSKLKELHLMASSPEEAASFIQIGREMGLLK